MDEVNVAVMAPILGRDLSFVSDVDSRVRVMDANFAVPGRPAGSDGPAASGSDLLETILAQAEVLLVGFPVPGNLTARSPRLVWAHHTQAGVSNLAGTASCSPRTSAAACAASPSSMWSIAPAGTSWYALCRYRRQVKLVGVRRHPGHLQPAAGTARSRAPAHLA